MNHHYKNDILFELLSKQYGNQDWWEENWLSDLVSMVLIQRTTERNAKRALEKLKPYLSLDFIKECDDETLHMLIQPAGFYRQKSLYLKNLIKWIESEDNLNRLRTGSTESIRKQLLEIKGIGPETADVILLYIFKRKVFIADVYARRLYLRLNLGDYHHYEPMRDALQPFVQTLSNKACREFHALIDTHEKMLNLKEESAIIFDQLLMEAVQ